MAGRSQASRPFHHIDPLVLPSFPLFDGISTLPPSLFIILCASALRGERRRSSAIRAAPLGQRRHSRLSAVGVNTDLHAQPPSTASAEIADNVRFIVFNLKLGEWGRLERNSRHSALILQSGQSLKFDSAPNSPLPRLSFRPISRNCASYLILF